MEIVLDTNFILACVENKADFIQLAGEIVIAREVVDELEEIRESGDLKKRLEAEIALKIIINNKGILQIVDFEDSYVDKGIIEYIKDKKDVAVGTLDKELRKKLKGKVRFVSLVARKKFEIS